MRYTITNPGDETPDLFATYEEGGKLPTNKAKTTSFFNKHFNKILSATALAVLATIETCRAQIPSKGEEVMNDPHLNSITEKLTPEDKEITACYLDAVGRSVQMVKVGTEEKFNSCEPELPKINKGQFSPYGIAEQANYRIARALDRNDLPPDTIEVVITTNGKLSPGDAYAIIKKPEVNGGVILETQLDKPEPAIPQLFN